MKYHVNLAALLGVLCLSPICHSEQTIDELLARYDQTQKSIQTKYVESETLREDRDSWAQKSNWFIERSELYTDGFRIDLKHRNWIPIRDKDDRELPDFGHIQVIWDNNSWYECREAERVERSRVFISKKEEKKNPYIPIGYPGAPLEGFFTGNLKTVSSIFHEADQVKLYNEKEYINGIPCYVLETTTVRGKHKIWLDPEHGYHICQAEVIKGKDDLYNDEPVSKPYPDWPKLGIKQPEGKPPLPTSPRVEILFTMRNVKFQEIKDIWIPISADWESKTTHKNGRVGTQIFNHKRIDIELSPDFDAAQAFVPKIRNGTRVLLTDGENPIIPFHWIEGRVEHNIDEVVLESMDETLEELIEESNDENIISSPEAEQITREHTDSLDKPEDVKGEKDISTARPIESETYDGWGSLLGRLTFFVLGSVIVLGSIGFLVLRIKRSKKNV